MGGLTLAALTSSDWTQIALTVAGAGVTVFASWVNLRERMIRLEGQVNPLTRNGIERRVAELEKKLGEHEAAEQAVAKLKDEIAVRAAREAKKGGA